MPESKARSRTAGTALERLPAGTHVPEIGASATSLSSTRTDLAVCFAFEPTGIPTAPGLPASGALAKALARLVRSEGFKGKRKETLLWQSAGRFPAARYLIVGLGKRSGYSVDLLREGCGMAARRALMVKARTMSVALPEAPANASFEALAGAATEGISLGAYRMAKYLTGEEDGKVHLSRVELLAPKAQGSEARRGITAGTVRSFATNLVRDLVNEPAMALTPMKMAEVAKRIAADRGLTIKVHVKKDLERMKMGALLGVSAGSHQPPCLIHLTYRPRGAPGRSGRLPKIALVGKGLTFDSGGLSLKTATGMETMKLDKAGASVVLGVLGALAELQPAVEVHGILGMTENMPGGSAIKPGDILRTMAGKTIEVLNTDAEGRLVLADALAYAARQGPDQIIDLATLTGACMVALGPVVTGVFGTNQPMVDRFLESARGAGEKMWQLPLYEEYADQIRSDIADIKNSPSSRYGGAITAALFLKNFVDDKTPWIHLDIAGPAFLESEQGFMRKGATGAVVRTLLTYVCSLAGSEAT
ncbi:MAG TPA: leucyl aminopeptidase [Candidatus Polarisedimenticolia bacterium]|jgi:leucyl aminopeptidase